MNNIAIPSYFISTFVKKKKIANIILTLQMAQTWNFLKSKAKIVLDVAVLTLHHAWPLCFMSIPCICP
jgi:hypothetical protein